ncbi:MAG: rRNA pseudouridine synthase [Bdellovibrionaceae bacterium]|nr:rRNA pseudouridine synthase [Pseudobdellovibrionaceae bacterium]
MAEKSNKTAAKQQDNSGTVRLNKFLADSGICSRRAADGIIADGRVLVNGKKVFELGIKVNPKEDRITVDRKPIKQVTDKVYLMLHKPKGILTTMEDELGRPTVAQYLETLPHRVFPVGRLDWDSEGLLLFTNDGEFANKVMQPKNDITKTYLVKVDGQPDDKNLNRLRMGVSIPGGRVRAVHVEKISRKEGSKQYNWIKIVINEGKNRQIRYMFEKIGYDVLKLQRIAIGQLKLGNLDRGELTYIDETDLKKVFIKDLPADTKPKTHTKPKAAKPSPGKHVGKRSFKATHKQNRDFNKLFREE